MRQGLDDACAEAGMCGLAVRFVGPRSIVGNRKAPAGSLRVVADQDFALCSGREAMLQRFGEMAVMDLLPRSASVRAVENCIAIRLSAANLYQVYAQDLKQFALIQMNMGREVSRRLRESDNRLFRARMGTPDADIEHVFLAG
jgi:CRP-like cAMP-binding protein